MRTCVLQPSSLCALLGRAELDGPALTRCPPGPAAAPPASQAYFTWDADESVAASVTIPVMSVTRRIGLGLAAQADVQKAVTLSFAAAEPPANSFENLASYSSQGERRGWGPGGRAALRSWAALCCAALDCAGGLPFCAAPPPGQRADLAAPRLRARALQAPPPTGG